MFGSAEAEGLFRTLRARSVPGRWHLLRGWHTARRASGQRQGFPGISPRLIWGCTVRQKGGAAGGLSAYSGQGAYWEDGISSGADTLPGGLPGSGRIPRHKATACMRLCCPAERQYSRWTSPPPLGKECIGTMAFAPVLPHCPACFRAAAGFPAIWAIPPQNKHPRRTGHAVRRGVFSCMGTGRIRLRHRATWRQWDSRERRLPKPGSQ